MYLPKEFDLADHARCHALMRAASFATLVTNDRRGTPFASHIPILVEPTGGALGTLIGHVARNNPQSRHFAHQRSALAIFQGPHGYISPAWYATSPQVPTWNYVAVHAYGVPGVIADPARVALLLKRLTDNFEGDRPDGWRMESLPDSYVAAMIKGIVAFEIPIERLEGKAKLGQNRLAADRRGAIAGLGATGGAMNAELARLMDEALASKDGDEPAAQA